MSSNFPQPVGAMLSGLDEGNQEAQSLPSAYQPQGKATPSNPCKGTLDIVVSSLLSCAALVGQQGDKYREIKQRLYKLSSEVQKTNNDIDKTAEEG